ncbi:MAG: hypothetical protein QNJ53_28855 [Pleurocapsa sp. MO_192.B19]|nr:hypothetical protein [Pleurocapsa sp. MO_192.B19]
MQFTQEHNSHGAVTVTFAGQKANSALVQTVRVEDIVGTSELTLKEQLLRLLEQESGVYLQTEQTEFNESGRRQGDDVLINPRAG